MKCVDEVPRFVHIVADATTNGFKTAYFNKDIPTYLGYAELQRRIG